MTLTSAEVAKMQKHNADLVRENATLTRDNVELRRQVEAIKNQAIEQGKLSTIIPICAICMHADVEELTGVCDKCYPRLDAEMWQPPELPDA